MSIEEDKDKKIQKLKDKMIDAMIEKHGERFRSDTNDTDEVLEHIRTLEWHKERVHPANKNIVEHDQAFYCLWRYIENVDNSILKINLMNELRYLDKEIVKYQLDRVEIETGFSVDQYKMLIITAEEDTPQRRAEIRSALIESEAYSEEDLKNLEKETGENASIFVPVFETAYRKFLLDELLNIRLEMDGYYPDDDFLISATDAENMKNEMMQGDVKEQEIIVFTEEYGRSIFHVPEELGALSDRFLHLEEMIGEQKASDNKDKLLEEQYRITLSVAFRSFAGSEENKMSLNFLKDKCNEDPNNKMLIKKIINEANAAIIEQRDHYKNIVVPRTGATEDQKKQAIECYAQDANDLFTLRGNSEKVFWPTIQAVRMELFLGCLDDVRHELAEDTNDQDFRVFRKPEIFPSI